MNGIIPYQTLCHTKSETKKKMQIKLIFKKHFIEF